MRQATRDYKSYKTSVEESKKSVLKPVTTLSEEDSSSNKTVDGIGESERNETEESEYNMSACAPEVTIITNSEDNQPTEKITVSTDEHINSSDEEKEEDNSEGDPIQDVDPGFLDYIYLAKLFA